MKPKFPFFSLYPSLNETKSLRGRAPATLSENHHLTQHGKVNTKIQRVWVTGYGGVNPQDKMTNRNVEERVKSTQPPTALSDFSIQLTFAVMVGPDNTGHRWHLISHLYSSHPLMPTANTQSTEASPGPRSEWMVL